MRRFGIVFACSAVALITFGVLGGNAQVGGGGKFGGFGGFGKDPASLIQRPDVKKELDLSEEQTEKLPGAVMKAVAEVLNDKQMARFKQIELQVRGTQAFVKDETLRKLLKITDSQTKSIEEVLAEAKKDVEEIVKEAKGTGGKGFFEKIQGVQKEAREKALGVLTSDQKKAYKEATGDEFKFERGKKKAE